MSIKDKPLKKCHSDARITIDVIHNDIISDYTKEKSELKRKLKIEKDEEKKREIQNKIEEINVNINNYYLKNGLLLNDYYNRDFNTSKPVEKNNILDFFKKEDDKEAETEKEKPVEKKDDIIITYLANVNDCYLNDNLKDADEKIHICVNCGNEHLTYKILESEVFCEKCGYTEKVLFENDKTSYKETPKEISYFAYKRINHFNEWIAQFQGKETTDIPDYIYQNVLYEIKKNINMNISDITNRQVRDILKKLKYNKYYEHIPNIINMITGKKAPIINRQYEELLRNMFKEIQVPFMKHCPENRKNFLSYSYVLHKFCELLELDHLLEYFPLLKSREKLQQQDVIWKKICQELEWQYIPSI
tara:strand:+ start:46 stop:1128 length:1083 start_codon:yes stop_codon:yes gene_type:complete